MKKQGCVVLQFPFPPARSTHPPSYFPPSRSDRTEVEQLLFRGLSQNKCFREEQYESKLLPRWKTTPAKRGPWASQTAVQKDELLIPVAWFLFAAGSWLVLPICKMCHLLFSQELLEVWQVLASLVAVEKKDGMLCLAWQVRELPGDDPLKCSGTN